MKFWELMAMLLIVGLMCCAMFLIGFGVGLRRMENYQLGVAQRKIQVALETVESAYWLGVQRGATDCEVFHGGK